MCSFFGFFFDLLLDRGGKFTASLELNDFFGSDLDGLPCLRVTARSCSSFTYGEGTKTYQSNTITFFEGITCGVYESIQSFFCVSF